MSDPYPHFLPELYQELKGCATNQPLSPNKLRRFFLLMLRGHWSSPTNYGPGLQETLGCLSWDPDGGNLGVELQGSTGALTRQHMLWVALGNFQARQVVFANQGARSSDNATQTYVMPCTAQLLINHDAPSLDQAFDMAWSTFTFLLGFQDSILDALGGEGAGFKVQLVGEPKQEEIVPKTRFRVDVGAVLSLNVAVDTTIESHKLKLVSLTAIPQ
jgi:hypothetical protein